jgi:hypothetical protein
MHSFVSQLPRCGIKSVWNALQANRTREVAEDLIVNEIDYRWPIAVSH